MRGRTGHPAGVEGPGGEKMVEHSFRSMELPTHAEGLSLITKAETPEQVRAAAGLYARVVARAAADADGSVGGSKSPSSIEDFLALKFLYQLEIHEEF